MSLLPQVEETLAAIGQQVSGFFYEQEPHAIEPFLLAREVLAANGVPSKLAVVDIAFDDSNFEGARVFALIVRGDNLPHNLAGNEGWDDIIEHEFSQTHADREWSIIDGTDTAWEIDQAIDAAREQSGWLPAIRAHLQAEKLNDITPVVELRKTRLGL